MADGGMMAKGGKIDEKPLSYYTYGTPQVTILWQGKPQPFGRFKSAQEAYEVIQEQSSMYGNMSDYEIKTPDKIIKLGKDGIMASGGMMAKGNNQTKYNISFNYNPANLSNEDAEKIVEKYTPDWKHDNDWDEVSFFVMNLSKSDADDLVSELKMEDVYNVEIEKSRYANGGMMESAETGELHRSYE